MIKYLFYIIILFCCSGCYAIRAKGILKDKIIEYKSVGNAPLYYKVYTKKGIFSLRYDIGQCGGGVLLLFPIPFPFWSINTCDKNFIIAGAIPVGVDNQILLKYNNQIHKPIRITQLGNFVFTDINTNDLKTATDATIILKDGEEVIIELPFEWRVGGFAP